MGFRLFGRGKDDDGEASCTRCGRTLLAGEWTQRLVDDDGDETYLCSLCAGASGAAVADPAVDATVETTPAGTGKVRSTRGESDAFWRAIKDKDAEIERLHDRLARAEAEKQELIAEIARMRDGGLRATTAVVGPPPTEPLTHDDAARGGQTDPGLAEKLRDATLDDDQMHGMPAGEPPAASDQPRLETAPVVAPLPAAPAMPAPRDGAGPEAALSDADADQTASLAVEWPADDAPAATPPGSITPPNAITPPHATPPGATMPSATAPPAAAVSVGVGDVDDEEGASLTILQRGVDLLNVSAVPRRIVETNESLGIPTVHVGSEGAHTLLVTFLWTMGWYQFRVELADGGRVTLAERGYDERTDLAPNATVRADGTIQIAAAMIKHAAVDRVPPHDEGPPAAPTTTSGTIISKSLMGQRTDDENVPPAWGAKNAPDFDWGR